MSLLCVQMMFAKQRGLNVPISHYNIVFMRARHSRRSLCGFLVPPAGGSLHNTNVHCETVGGSFLYSSKNMYKMNNCNKIAPLSVCKTKEGVKTTSSLLLLRNLKALKHNLWNLCQTKADCLSCWLATPINELQNMTGLLWSYWSGCSPPSCSPVTAPLF